MAGSISGVLLVDAPILSLVHFHNALRAEFAELRRIAVEASENTTHSREFILDLRRRFEFLKLFYSYHSATEDEIIFLALDVHVKNVVCTYSLEHKSIDDLFDSVFHCLNILTKEDEDISKPFQELVYCIGSIQTTICQHMLKEEEQVFPLLMQQFSSREQASLVWQFLCSIPIMLLEVFFPWMSSFLSPNERLEFMNCIKDVVPKEKLLQEVVISWLDNKEQISLGAKYGEGAQVLNGLANFEDILKLHTDEGHSEKEQQMIKEYSIHITGGHNPIDGIHLWHGAIRKDLKEILEELCQIRRSNSFSTLASVVVHLKFFADVLVFYSNALDKIFHPLWHELAKDCPSPSYERFLDDSQIQSLQKLLYYKDQTVIPLSNFVEKLCGELESFVRMINKHLTFLETEVFAFVSMNCSHQMQKWLLYTSLQMMPLGLLKCMITWFSAQLSDYESKSIMYSINQEGPLASKPLASLICEWVRIGYSGKTSVEKFRKDLHEVFNSRCPFPPEQIKEDSLHINSRSLETKSFTKAKNRISPSSSSGSNTTKWHDTSYNSGINMHVYFPQKLKISSPLPSFPAEDTGLGSVFNLELRPMDHILFFHKALKKDLEYLVFASAKLVENVGLVMDFHRRFHLVRFLYQIHSDSEDDVAFPALEAKGKLQNISHSYTIDHKMEVEHFSRISIILDEISGLHVLVSSGDVDALGQRRLKYRQLCVKLHDMCISIRKIVCDHINHEEIELWPLFGEHFSIIEQEKIIGCMLGRVRAEILQEMIPWLMASLTIEQQNAMMSLWRRATKNTMFDEWLREWWEGMTWHDKVEVEEESAVPLSSIVDPLEVVSTYLLKEGFDEQGGTLGDKGAEPLQSDFYANETKKSGTPNEDAREKVIDKDQYSHQMFSSEVEKKKFNEVTDVIYQPDDLDQTFKHHDHFLIMTQEELEAAIRRVSRDSTLDPRKKSHITQIMIMSRWTATQQKSHPKEVDVLSNKEEIIGQCFSYRDPLKLTYGCKHYKRNCKLVSSCCNKLYTCRYCHDGVEEHVMDRKATTKMMCMKCLIIQPIGPICSTASCNGLSMARYYCRICKFFDDEREIYHCPYCNLCRVGKGLGIDYFHCMNCNACMSRSLSVHICREKGFEDFCPICHEFIFTSSSPIKALPCGHMMHSACFQDYTCTHYICPICSKSLGDMQVYFGMIDALLAEEKIPDEYAGQTQDILCNDCEKRGIASFHWLYHKCADCGSYNTRLL